MSVAAAGAPVAVGYLGPEGSFTHAAARQWSRESVSRPALIPRGSVGEVVAAVAAGDDALGVVALENSVEGYVAPTVDALTGSTDVVAVGQVELAISFDAFVRPGADRAALTHVAAHPHGLAQVQRFVRELGLAPRAAASNAAACRDLAADGIAIGPALCGELYGLDTLRERVEDYPGASTRFVVVARRDQAAGHLAEAVPARPWATMLAVTPTVTGPGVLARVSEEFGRRGVNMSSLVTRPVKAAAGQYVFVITCDGAPWEEPMRGLLRGLLAAGDAVKTLGVFPVTAAQRAADRVAQATVPPGSVTAGDPPADLDRSLVWRR